MNFKTLSLETTCLQPVYLFKLHKLIFYVSFTLRDMITFSDPVSIETSQSVNVSSLPSAPRAQREGSFDPSKVPRSPPFTAFVGNLPFDSDDEDIVKMFAKNTVSKQ